MFERDYVVRMFTRFAQELARLINRNQSERDFDVMQDLEGLFLRYTGLEAGFAERLDGMDLLEIFSDSAEGAGKALVAAEIWSFMAENLLNSGRVDRSDHLRRLSIELYAAAMRRDPEFADTKSLYRALVVLESLPLARWTLAVAEAAAFLFEKGRKFARAEDALFMLLDRDVEGAPQAAEQFYYRMLRLDDAELTAGGLPREEVEEGLREVLRRQRGGSGL